MDQEWKDKLGLQKEALGEKEDEVKGKPIPRIKTLRSSLLVLPRMSGEPSSMGRSCNLFKKTLRRGVASCDKAHIGGSLQEEREGAEKGAGGTERGTETVPWGQEWRKRKRGREGERTSWEEGKVHFYKGT